MEGDGGSPEIPLKHGPWDVRELAQLQGPETTQKDVMISRPYLFQPRQPTDTFCPEYHFEQKFGEANMEELLQAAAVCMSTANYPHGAGPIPATVDKGSASRDLADLGTGYLNDSFVDDLAKAQEARIPAGFTTQCGGHYIGTGPLQIRPVQPSELHSCVWISMTNEQCQRLCENGLAASDGHLEENKRTFHQQPAELVEPRKKRMRGILPEPGVLASIGQHIPSTSMALHDDLPMASQTSDSSAQPGTTLPFGLPEILVKSCEELKNLGRNWTGTKRLFMKSDKNPLLNATLLRLEHECIKRDTNTRSRLYSHISQFTPSSKKSLSDRGRLIVKEDLENKAEQALKALLNSLEGSADTAGLKNRRKSTQLIGQAFAFKLSILNMCKFSLSKDKYLEEWLSSELWREIRSLPRFAAYEMENSILSYQTED